MLSHLLSSLSPRLTARCLCCVAQFITVEGREGQEVLVDVHFKDAFTIPCPTKVYSALLEQVRGRQGWRGGGLGGVTWRRGAQLDP